MKPRLEHAGSDVRLTITSTCLKLTSLETGAVIAVHDMPNISFASGGDAVSFTNKCIILNIGLTDKQRLKKILSWTLFFGVFSDDAGFCCIRGQRCHCWSSLFCSRMWEWARSGCNHYRWSSVWASFQGILTKTTPSTSVSVKKSIPSLNIQFSRTRGKKVKKRRDLNVGRGRLAAGAWEYFRE